MKTFLVLALLSTSAIAATVKITSFTSVRMGDTLDHPLAELCGKVTDAEKLPAFIKVTVDPGSRNPGTYNTLTDETGKFCLSLISYRGRADVAIMGEQKITKAELK